MKFLYSGWLYALLILPLLYGVMVWDEKRRKARFSAFISPLLWSRVVPDLEPRHREKRAKVFLLALCFLLTALARPQLGTHEESVKSTGLDLMVVLDVSSSMETEDVVPSRLKKAKHLIKTVLDRLGGDRVGVVSFAESSSVSCPLTTDLDYAWETVQMLDPRFVQSQGTDVGIGLDTALRSIERGSEGSQKIPDASEAGAPTTQVILLISDGEDHEGQAIEVAKKLKAQGIRLYVLGVGTEKGGPIPLKDDTGNSQGFKRDRSGQAILSTFHPAFLSQVADAAGGRYWTITDNEVEANELLQELGTLDRQSFQERRYTVYEERFQIPLLIAVLLLLLELSIPARRIIRTGGLAGVFLMAQFLCSGAAYSDPKPPAVDVYLENQKGLEAYKAGQIEEARSHFGAAQARDPSRPELEYNQGVIEMENGDPDRAIQAFLKSAQTAKDPALESKAYYNLGQAFTKKEDIKSAIQGYVGAIDAATRAGNQSLEMKARKNLELLIQEQQKKQEQKQQEKQKDEKKPGDKSEDKSQDKPDNKKEKQGEKKADDKDGKDKKESKDEGKPGDKSKDPKDKPKDNEEKKDGKPEDKSNDKPNDKGDQPKGSIGQRKQPFNSKKMTAEDADRVMSELANQEKRLQEKLQKNRVKSQNNAKDW